MPVKWMKAAVIGCLWASSEILIGSFLHNLKIPFRGSILTGIAIILMITIAHTWREKGLFWRAGIVCALMKPLSPSAVILGPMIAIITEGILFETATRTFGRNYFGFIFGALLAMSWNFAQSILSYLITFGGKIFDMYSNYLIYIESLLGTAAKIALNPLLIYLLIHVVMGLIAAIAGIIIGKKSILKKDIFSPNLVKVVPFFQKRNEMSYSIFNLFLIFIFIISSLTLSVYSPRYFWMPFCISGLVILIWRYKFVMQRLKKIKFWLSIIIITLFSSVLLGWLGVQNNIIFGLLAGIDMNVRAACLIFSFAALSAELKNPVIENIFFRSRFRQLSIIVDTSVFTLPYIISSFPNPKYLFKNFSSAIVETVNQSEYWLQFIDNKIKNKKNVVIIITGEVGTGKTSFLKKLIVRFEEQNIKTGGLLSKRIYQNEKLEGYDLFSIKQNKYVPLIREKCFSENDLSLGSYYFNSETINIGNKILLEDSKLSDILIIDEIGPLELNNNGWANTITTILTSTKIPMIWIVRTSLLHEVQRKWGIQASLVINEIKNDEKNIEFYADKIIQQLKCYE